MKKCGVRILDAIGGTVQIQAESRHCWTVIQRYDGENQDNNQNPTWLAVENAGSEVRVRLQVQWATSEWMPYRKFGYLKCGTQWDVIKGEVDATTTTYEFSAPTGVINFAVLPWYSNEDADRFFKKVCRQSPLCQVQTIGHSREGRAIQALTVGRSQPGKKNVLVVGREHAGETPASFMIEAIVKYLLSGKASEKWLRRFVFHFLPIANPDGVANGTKNPQLGPDRASDGSNLYYAGMTSADPTCQVVRDYKIRLRPACFLNYHSFLFPIPQIIFYDKKKGMRVLDFLLGEPNPKDCSDWMVKRQREAGHSLDTYLWKRFRTQSVCFEVPWAGRSVQEIEALGVKTLESILAAESDG